MQVSEKVGKSRFTLFFQWFVAQEGRKVGAAGAEPAGQMRDEKLHVVVARSTFRSQHVQSTPGSDHFWTLRCRKNARCVVARSTFPSQKCKKLTGSDHFWKLRCRKSARRCGAKHIWKSKVSKTAAFEPILMELLKLAQLVKFVELVKLVCY